MKRIIAKSIISLFDFYDPRDGTSSDAQVQIMTNQTFLIAEFIISTVL